MGKIDQHAGVTGNKTRIEQAEARTEQAEARTEQAEARTEQAETRTEQAKTRTESAETRTEQAETRTELAKTRTEQAETEPSRPRRDEQAETILQRVVNKEVHLSPEISTRFLKKIPLQAIADRKGPLEELTGASARDSPTHRRRPEHQTDRRDPEGQSQNRRIPSHEVDELLEHS